MYAGSENRSLMRRIRLLSLVVHTTRMLPLLGIAMAPPFVAKIKQPPQFAELVEREVIGAEVEAVESGNSFPTLVGSNIASILIAVGYLMLTLPASCPCKYCLTLCYEVMQRTGDYKRVDIAIEPAVLASLETVEEVHQLGHFQVAVI